MNRMREEGILLGTDGPFLASHRPPLLDGRQIDCRVLTRFSRRLALSVECPICFSLSLTLLGTFVRNDKLASDIRQRGLIARHFGGISLTFTFRGNPRSISRQPPSGSLAAIVPLCKTACRDHRSSPSRLSFDRGRVPR